MGKRVKIVLDSDVIIHFYKGGLLASLPDIFPNYEYVVLPQVYDEIKVAETRKYLDKLSEWMKKITLLPFDPDGEMLQEYLRLKDDLDHGKGESACMVYCRYNQDVLGSSNLKDTVEYCKENHITYLTTLDFLYYAIKFKIISLNEANDFIANVRSKGSILPDVDMGSYVCKTLI